MVPKKSLRCPAKGCVDFGCRMQRSARPSSDRSAGRQGCAPGWVDCERSPLARASVGCGGWPFLGGRWFLQPADPPGFIASTALLRSATPSHAADAFKINPFHALIGFYAVHLGVTDFYGRFDDVSGDILLEQENPGESSITVTVPTERIDTLNLERDQHLERPDFSNSK